MAFRQYYRRTQKKTYDSLLIYWKHVMIGLKISFTKTCLESTGDVLTPCIISKMFIIVNHNGFLKIDIFLR